MSAEGRAESPVPRPEGSAAAVETLRSGRYTILGSLGAGSQGETLEAVDKLEGRAVAIERFTIRGAKSWKDVELAEREAAVLSSLNHPSLPRYVEHFEEQGQLYLVMEKVEGETLAARRKRGAGLSQEQVVRLLHEAAVCLAYLHGHSPPVVHRDIKPGNVILRPDGSYCLVDFGSVRDRLKPEGGSTVVGTFGYMAPEQFQGRAGPASDVYAVGATAISLLTGREPEDLPHKGLALDVQKTLSGQVDRRLTHALTRMLEPNPDRRAKSVAAALTDAGLNAPSARSARPRVAPKEHDAERGTPRSAQGAWRPSQEHAEEWRRDRKRDRREAKRERKAERRYERNARRAERYAGGGAWSRSDGGDWGRRHWPVPVILGIVLILALRVAGVATFALFRVLLPLLFAVLAIFFGRHLYRKGQRLAAIGRAGESGLSRATDHIRRHFLNRNGSDDAAAPSTRTRVDQRTRVEPNADPSEPETDELGEPEHHEPAERAPRSAR